MKTNYPEPLQPPPPPPHPHIHNYYSMKCQVICLTHSWVFTYLRTGRQCSSCLLQADRVPENVLGYSSQHKKVMELLLFFSQEIPSTTLLIVCIQYVYSVPSYPRGNYSSEFLVEVCHPVPQILTQFQTKIFHFPHPFSDLDSTDPYPFSARMIYFGYFCFFTIHLELKRQIRLYAPMVPLKTIPDLRP